MRRGDRGLRRSSSGRFGFVAMTQRCAPFGKRALEIPFSGEAAQRRRDPQQGSLRLDSILLRARIDHLDFAVWSESDDRHEFVARPACTESYAQWCCDLMTRPQCGQMRTLGCWQEADVRVPSASRPR